MKPLPAAAGATEMETVFGGVENVVIVETLNVVETGVVELTNAEIICEFGLTLRTGSWLANKVTSTVCGGAVEPYLAAAE